MREGLSRSLKNLVILARKRASNESTPPRPCKWVRATEEEKKTQDGRRRGARAAHSIARPPDRPAAAINMQKIFCRCIVGLVSSQQAQRYSTSTWLEQRIRLLVKVQKAKMIRLVQ